MSSFLGVVAPGVRSAFLRDRAEYHGHVVIAYAKDIERINLYQTEETDKITDKVTKTVG
jgi:hypothetical protein